MYRSMVFGVIICIGVLITGCGQQGSTDPVVLKVPVTIEIVGRGEVSSIISQTGSILPVEEMAITVEAGGEIHFIQLNDSPLKEGDRIEKGQIIASLTNEEYLLSISIESKKMSLDHAKRDLEDKKNMQRLGGATQREIETAERNVLNAETGYQSALLNLDKLNVKSPLTGILTDFNPFIEGQKISNGTQIGRVIRYDRVICEINITTDDINKVWIGQEVLVTDISHGNVVYNGRVTKISSTIDPATRTFQLQIQIPNPELRIRPGSFVKTDIVVEKRQNVIKIPKHVIVTRKSRQVVFIAVDEVAKEKAVVIGLQDSEYAEIIEGLNEGDRLIIRNYETLSNNQKVRISR